MENQWISRLPGSEPILLDLEKLFLLSDSVENLKLYLKNEISGPAKKKKIPLGPFWGTIRNELPVYTQTLLVVNLIVVKNTGFLVITRNPPEHF